MGENGKTGRRVRTNSESNDRLARMLCVSRDSTDFARAKHSTVDRAPAFAASVPGLRVALYSHDTMGLGHIRRNLVISRTLAGSHFQATVLMIAGATEARLFQMPSRVDCLTLPALRKKFDGRYQARSLGLSLQEIILVRASAIRAAVEAFSPDVLIVDNVPRGAVGELNPTLRYLRDKGTARCILGLRDVLDDPESVRREWHERANEDAIFGHYDAVWVYGDPAVFDVVGEYGWAGRTARKVRYTGYLDRRPGRPRAAPHWTASAAADLDLPPGRLLLVTAGGGQDGGPLMQALVQAELPSGSNCVAVTGPFMPANTKQALAARAARDQRFKVIEFLPEPTDLLERADQVIAMGGYNTVSEILSFEKPALIVPRVEPRQEQLIRARRMQKLGLVDVLHPQDLKPATLSAWLARGRRRAPKARDVIDFEGLSRLPALLTDVLTAPLPLRRGRTGEAGSPAAVTAARAPFAESGAKESRR